jgi:dTMP kinase
MESEAIEFHERVRRTFLSLAAQSRDRYLVVDATTGADRIHEVVTARVLQLLLAGDVPQDALSLSMAEVRP